jgi:hypothetical protein
MEFKRMEFKRMELGIWDRAYGIGHMGFRIYRAYGIRIYRAYGIGHMGSESMEPDLWDQTHGYSDANSDSVVLSLPPQSPLFQYSPCDHGQNYFRSLLSRRHG